MSMEHIVGAINNLALHLASLEIQLEAMETEFRLAREEIMRIQDYFARVYDSESGFSGGRGIGPAKKVD